MFVQECAGRLRQEQGHGLPTNIDIKGNPLELRQLRYFVRVIQHGSMGRAAMELGVVTSTLSHRRVPGASPSPRNG
jgi:hypothetical protein